MNRNALLKFSIMLDQQLLEEEVDLKEISSINELDIINEFKDHPAKVAWFGTLLAAYTNEYQKAKKQYEIIKHTVSLTVREQLNNSGQRVTESIVEAKTNIHDSVIEAYNKMIELEKNVNMLKVITKMLSDKRDCLIQIAGFQKKELIST